jgi:hypothetical protein
MNTKFCYLQLLGIEVQHKVQLRKEEKHKDV